MPLLSADFDLTYGATAQVVTVFALTCAVAAPLTTTMTARWPRRNVLVTAGAAIGAVFGWRITMWMAVGIALVGVVGVASLIPSAVGGTEGGGLQERLAPLRDRRVLALLATTLLAFTAVYIPYTYIGAPEARRLAELGKQCRSRRRCSSGVSGPRLRIGALDALVCLRPLGRIEEPEREASDG